MSSFAALPVELHLQIGSYCSRRGLRALCRTSKPMNQLYTGKLYEEVDLSRKFRKFHRTMQTAMFPKTEYKHYLNKHYHKQIKFFRTIELHPEYAKYVHSLSWTPLDDSISQRMTTSRPSAPSDLPAESDRMMEISMMLLVNVSHVEISNTDIHGQVYQYQYLGDLSLFPKVTSISLQGKVPEALVKAVLPSSKASQLQHLTLRHVFIKGARRHRDQDPIHYTMLLVNSLIGECTSLRSLTLVHDWNGLVSQDDWLETTRLRSYFALPKSVSRTLETLHFEIKGKDGDWASDQDPWFFDDVQAVLKECTWPRLRKVIVLPARDDDAMGRDTDNDSRVLGSSALSKICVHNIVALLWRR